MDNISWGRVQSALSQAARTQGVSRKRLRDVVRRLPGLIELCGPGSQTRKVAIRIGATLLQGPPQLIVPSCPDYSHYRGRYTFKDVRGGVSLVTRKHILFMQAVAKIFPDMQVLALIADHEADDPALCQVAGISRKEFYTRIRRSVVSTRRAFRSQELDWNVALMTDVVPNLVAREAELMEMIRSEPRFQGHIESDTLERAAMYNRLRIRGREARRERTIRTAAQYMTLGQFAVDNGRLIVNHSTTNLAWYLKTKAGFLHNPVRVY